MSGRVVVLEISVLEAVHLSGMVEQFLELLDSSDIDGATPSDPAIARLVPDAYTGDVDASTEFRRLTGSDLFDRRRHDAGVVLATLATEDTDADLNSVSDEDLTRSFVMTLDDEEAGAWMRVLAAVRLVLASRLGIETENDHDEHDPRFGVYEWLGVRLEGLVHAIDAA
ncbi:DUF2017 family protein [Microbacterium sp. P06]|uniref:DUF2017 family protein n=1 Tax=unclassified Microbacterium TaxID=2609290 RepID=UPI0037469CF4